MIIVLRD